MSVEEIKPRRKSIRLKEYDLPHEMIKHNYSNKYKGIILSHGVNSQAVGYFVTICTKNRICFFGKVEDKKMVLNDSGKMIQTERLKLSNRFNQIEIDQFMVMPNHFHGIIIINNDESVGAPLVGAQRPRAGTRPAPTTLGDMVAAFESITTNAYIRGVKQHCWPSFPGKLWQRNYAACPERSRRERVISKMADDEDHPNNWT